MPRISILPGDPGYSHMQELRKAGETPRVYLDGKRVEHCITADESRGFVIRTACDAQGNPGDWRNPLNRRIVRGKVEIRTGDTPCPG